MIGRPWRPLLPVLSSIVLAACVGTPSQGPRRAIIRKPVTAIENTPQPDIVPPALAAPMANVDVWQQLRGSFAMSDCDADPAVLGWARQYTKNPERFEDQLRLAMPQLTYVSEVASRYDVAGEFVLLPWIESGFQPLPGRRNRPAGMWQIMPLTAGHMGLRVDGRYDARLDVDASANAVMKMLKQYHDQFNDWRAVDYAYNTGEFHVAKLVQKFGVPPAEPVIPRWPVKSGTKEHLTRLLAMACVVRDPDRFNVTLPTLTSEHHLVQVSIPHSMPMTQAASNAGMSVNTLKDMNAAFRSDTVDASASSFLMLPADHAQQFRDSAVQPADASTTASQPVDTVDKSDDMPKAVSKSRPARGHEKNHTVKRGESLSQIARHYSLSTKELQRWNHLQGSSLKTGQILKLSAGD
jgi:membrane-bound lytic murein transglycosylase D